MNIYQGRMLDRAGSTTRSFEAEEDYQAPDEYVAQFCDYQDEGLCFVQIRDGESWQTWRVEIIHSGPPLVMFTEMCTEEAAREEIAKSKEQAS